MTARSLFIRALVGILLLSLMVLLGVVLTAAGERASRPPAPDRATTARAVSDAGGHHRSRAAGRLHTRRAQRERARPGPTWRSASI